jgi:hypothetical protein
MERVNAERGQAAFTLKERYQRAKVSHMNESMPDAAVPVPEDNLEENVEWFEVDEHNIVHAFNAANQGSVGTDDKEDEEIVPCDSKSPSGNRKVKAQFGRRRTHNEQTLVRPCGLIFARATFFGAEAVSNVLVTPFGIVSHPHDHG